MYENASTGNYDHLTDKLDILPLFSLKYLHSESYDIDIFKVKIVSKQKLLNTNLVPFGGSKELQCALAHVAQLIGASSHKQKGHGFNSQSEHMPRLWVQSLSLCLSLPFSAPLASGINKYILG